MKDGYLTRQQLAVECGVYPTTIFKWELKGRIKSGFRKGRIVYSPEEVARLKESREFKTRSCRQTESETPEPRDAVNEVLMLWLQASYEELGSGEASPIRNAITKKFLELLWESMRS